MKLVAEYNYYLTAGYFTFSRELKPYGYFDIFQDMATRHVDEFSLGYDALFSKGIIWVLARVKYEIFHPIIHEMKIIGRTWPHPHRRFDTVRDYLLMDENGKVMAKGSSLWCLVDYQTGRLLSTSVVPFEGEFVEEYNYDGKFEKILYNKELLTDLGDYQVSLSDIDWNGHMNNAKYSEIVFDLLSKEEIKSLKGMEIDFLLQTFLLEKIELKGYDLEKEKIIVGYKGENACFIAKCLFK